MSDIKFFYGGLFVLPFVLEMSNNYCSHKCAYCFANLNKPDRKASPAATMRFLSELYEQKNGQWKRNSLEAFFMREKYPLLMSNRSDPFAESNYRITVPIIHTLIQMNQPVTFQTRGAVTPKAHDALLSVLDSLPPSSWYISICHFDDTKRKQTEPASPSIPYRIDLIKTLVSKNHIVKVGINPIVPEFISAKETEELLLLLKHIGVNGVFLQPLHLSTDMKLNMTQYEKNAMPPSLLERSSKRFNHQSRLEDIALLAHARYFAQSIGLHVTYNGDPSPTRYWQAEHALYKKTVYTYSDFILYLHSLPKDQFYGYVDFDMFADFFEKNFPQGNLKLDSFVHINDRHAAEKFVVPQKFTFYQLLEFIWNETSSPYNPLHHPAFEHAENENGEFLFDNCGRIVLSLLEEKERLV